jgi:glycosyltransferase involved in cell wall biosynthesis
MSSVTKRVLIIVENDAVPFDPRVWKEALALHAAGYEVRILSPKDKGYERGYEFRDGIHIYRHPIPASGEGALGYVWEYGCALFWEFLYSWWIYLRHGFDVIQGCNPPDDIFLVALTFRPFGVRFIFDHHDVNPELYLAKYGRRDFLYRVLGRLEKLTFRFCDVAISTNESYKQIALTRGAMQDEDVFVVRNGPDPETFKLVPANPAHRHGKRYLVGYVGIMSTQDGLDILLDAALELKKQGRNDVHFTCVGGGPELPSLRKMNEEKNLGDMVTFTGRIPDAELLEILSTADVCVNPDRPCTMNSMSTMIKIMEYMTLGKPIVQFEGVEGRFSAQSSSLYSNGDGNIARDFADKIAWLLDNPEERKRMGEFGHKRVEEQLAWEHSVPSLLAAYERAFSKVRGKRALQTDVAGS